MHQPRKRFGQHFLHDDHVIARIVAAIAPRAGDHLVEIGPGLGALTTKILPLIGAMDVVELDRDLIPELKALCQDLGTLNIYQADALRFDFTQLATPEKPLRVFGNLPYNISTPLLFHLLSQLQIIKDMHFMLQKEVVERMAASAGSEHYGRLSVMVQYYCAVEALFTVSKGAFTPPPKVESAVVRLTPYAKPKYVANNPEVFAQVVKLAFSQRRKMLRNSVQKMMTSEQLTALGIDPKIRPEQLTVADFVKISNNVSGLRIED